MKLLYSCMNVVLLSNHERVGQLYKAVEAIVINIV